MIKDNHEAYSMGRNSILYAIKYENVENPERRTNFSSRFKGSPDVADVVFPQVGGPRRLKIRPMRKLPGT